MEKRLIRTFICIELPETLKSKIGQVQDSLKQHGGNVSWTRPQNIHLTLKFLGDVEEIRIAGIAAAIEEVVGKYPTFTLIPSGQGVFPTPKAPRVFWVGVKDESNTLPELAREIEERLEEFGFEKEKRRFTPHLTIGRARQPNKAAELGKAFLETNFSAEPFEATEIIVMQSELNPAGSIYTPLHHAELKRET
jgi:2'-5' RNA ligase